MTAPKKPRGVPQHYVVKFPAGGGFGEMTARPLVLPTEKPAIERIIAEGFFRDANSELLGLEFLSPPVQNSEADIDFSVLTSKGEFGMELVEFAPLGQGSYAAAQPIPYSPAGRAADVAALIAKKNSKYADVSRWPQKILLVYVTHNPFALDGRAIAALQTALDGAKPVFDLVAYYKPMASLPGIVQRLYPLAEEERLRAGRVNANGRMTPLPL